MRDGAVFRVAAEIDADHALGAESAVEGDDLLGLGEGVSAVDGEDELGSQAGVGGFEEADGGEDGIDVGLLGDGGGGDGAGRGAEF